MRYRVQTLFLAVELSVVSADSGYASRGNFAEVTFGESQSPRIERARRPVRIVLPTAIKTTIAKEMPGYRLPGNEDYKLDWVEFYKEDPVPFAALGDFNRDGRKDVAALLVSDKGDDVWRLVVFHGGPKGFSTAVLVASPEEDKASPQYGQTYGPVQRHGIAAKNKCSDGRPCLELFVFESASHEYVWDGRGYKQITISD